MLVQLSDLHLRGAGEGEGPARRVRHAARAAAELQPSATAILLSGDIADSPSSSAYETAQELLAPLGLPLHAIPGNHDDPALLAARPRAVESDHPQLTAGEHEARGCVLP